MSPKAPSMEILREKWQRQLMADPKIKLSHLKVAIAIGFHLNRNEGGWAWPGIQRIAAITHVHPRTVMRATAWLSDMGYMEVVRIRKGKRNLPNHYRPILKQAVASRSSARAMSRGGGKAMSLGSGAAVSPEPLTEPLTEPHTPINISAPTDVGVDESGIRKETENETVEMPGTISAAAKCYCLAGHYNGDRGRKLVTKALEGGADPQDVLHEIGAAMEAGDDLGYALQSFFNSWG